MKGKLFSRALCLFVAAMFVTMSACSSGDKDGGGSVSATNTPTPAPSGSTESSSTQTETPAETTTETTVVTVTEAVDEMSITDRIALMASAKTTAEIPDWTGKEMNLALWWGHGTGDARRVISSNDVVSPELKRITGITLDPDRSFDNGGMDLMSKLAVLAATNDFPEIGYNVITPELLDGNKLYDLTDLVPTYAPNIHQRQINLAPETYRRGTNNTGRIYGLGISWWPQSLDELEAIAGQAGFARETQRVNRVFDLGDTMDWISVFWMRDDILKLIYPDAKSQDEIEALYMQQGYFTREQVYDVPIKSKEDFYTFVYDIKRVIDENNINENGRPVYATYVNNGADNWWSGAFLVGVLNGHNAWNYFTYFDLSTGHIEDGMKADFFQDDWRRISRFVRDGVAPESCLIDDNEMWMNRRDNGEYALLQATSHEPNRDLLASAEKPYRYRKLYLDIPQDLTRMIPTRGENGGHIQLSIFNDKVAEEDIPQILMFFDFMLTNAGMDLATWGPETAGLWTVENGARRFIDPELEDCLIYKAGNALNEKYNLIGGMDGDYLLNYPCIYPGAMGGSVMGARYQYDFYSDLQVNRANDYFKTGNFEVIRKSKEPISLTANVWSFFAAVPELQRFWDVRGTGFEPAMTRCLAARSDDEYEAAYAAMIQFADDNGYNDASIAEAEAWMKAEYPDDWAGYLAGF